MIDQSCPQCDLRPSSRYGPLCPPCARLRANAAKLARQLAELGPRPEPIEGPAVTIVRRDPPPVPIIRWNPDAGRFDVVDDPTGVLIEEATADV